MIKILRDSAPADGGAQPLSLLASTDPKAQAIVDDAKKVIAALSPLALGMGPYGGLVVLGANALASFAPSIIAEVERLFASGEIPDDQQQATLDAINKLKAALPTLFSGPEWQQVTIATQPPIS